MINTLAEKEFSSVGPTSRKVNFIAMPRVWLYGENRCNIYVNFASENFICIPIKDDTVAENWAKN